MNCPVCNDVRMREVVKNDILIDICPTCKGVWLDRGELDKLMQGVREVREPFNEWYEGDKPARRPSYDQRDNPSYDRDRNGQPYRKKKNIMDVFGDLFD